VNNIYIINVIND